MPLTEEGLKAQMKEAAEDIAEEIENSDSKDPRDDAQELIASAWPIQSLDSFPEYPVDEADVDALRDLATIFSVAEEYIETDPGLWEEQPPFQALATQAYYSFESMMMVEIEKHVELDPD